VADPQLVIFDLDGTLVDSFADIERSIVCALTAIDVEPTPALLTLCRKGVSLEYSFGVATGCEPSEPASRARLRTFVDTYRDNYFADEFASTAYASVPATLAWLRDTHSHIRLAVATTKRTDMARVVVDRCGLSGLFDLVQGSDGLPKKPDPALLRVVAGELDVPMQAAMMLGDTDKDVLAAKAAGCTAVAVSYGGWTRDEMLTLDPDHLLDDLAELRALIAA